MKKTIYFIVLLFLVLLPKNVKAACSDSEMVRLQRIANNINISYLFDETTKKFTIIFTNLKDELEIEDLYEGNTYSRNGELSIPNNYSGRHVYYIYSKNKACGSNYIASKSINLLFYNYYYQNELCKNHPGKYYCLKWVKSNIDYDEWEKNVLSYGSGMNKEDKSIKVESLFEIIMNFYLKYYLIILPSIIVVLGVILIIDSRKNRLA